MHQLGCYSQRSILLGKELFANVRIAGSSPASPQSYAKAEPFNSQNALNIVASLFHFATDLAHNLLREAFGPCLRSFHALVEDNRLLRHQLTAERRLVEGERVFEFLLGEPRGVKLGHLGESLCTA